MGSCHSRSPRRPSKRRNRLNSNPNHLPDHAPEKYLSSPPAEKVPQPPSPISPERAKSDISSFKTGSSDRTAVDTHDRDLGTVVYQVLNRRLVVPRPYSYQAAVALAIQHIPFPVSPKQVRILAKAPWLEEEAEVTSDAWAIVSPSVSLFRIELVKADQNTTNSDGPREMRIFVSTRGQQKYALNVRNTDTIESVQAQIRGEKGVCPGDLAIGRTWMEPQKTLADYNVQPDDTLNYLPDVMVCRKPIIYLYPPVPMDVNVRLSLVPQWRFSAIYPGASIETAKLPGEVAAGQQIIWDVSAHQDGILVDKRTGAEVSYLFWEAETDPRSSLTPPASRPGSPELANHSPQSEGFQPGLSKCSPHDSVLLSVADAPAYLDKVLLALGLHTEARTSFITYWLPDILKHQFVALRLVQQESYERAAPLDITPKPDVVTRVFMLFQGVKQGDVEAWSEAIARAEEPVAFWKAVVGTDEAKQNDESIFRVLEWGGMEVS